MATRHKALGAALGAALGSTLTLKSSADAAGDATMPAGVSAGDLLILASSIETEADNLSLPAGWTLIANVSKKGRVAACAKIADGTETGVTPLFDKTATTSVIVVMEGGLAALGTFPDTNAQSTDVKPATQVVNASTLGTLPFVVFAFWGGPSSVTGRVYSGDTPDFTIGAGNRFLSANYYGVGASPPDITVQRADDGNANAMLSAIIEVS